MSEEWIPVLHVPNEPIGESIAQMLREEGVPAAFRSAPSAEPGLLPGAGQIMVPADRADDARALLEEGEEG